MRQAIIRTTTLTALAALLVAGCGEKDESTAAEPAPEASAFPDPGKGSLQELVGESAPGDDLVVSPAGQVFTQGRNRLGLGVFTVEREQITDADVAVYAAHGADGRVQGPYPARVESLETEPAFTAENTASDPDAAKAVYVTELTLDQPGEWRMVALVRQDDEFAAVTMPSIVVRANDPVPAPGEQAPSVHTPTSNQVSNIEEIDTRVPPSSMHERRSRRRPRRKARCPAVRDAGAVLQPRLRPRRRRRRAGQARPRGRRRLHPHGDLQRQPRRQGGP